MNDPTTRHETQTAESEMGKPMYEGPNGFTAVVTHSVYLNGFPSQTRGPVLAVYCLDEHDNVLVQPRWLTPAGVGVHCGPIFTTQALRGSFDAHDIEALNWFPANQINFLTWSDLAIKNAP